MERVSRKFVLIHISSFTLSFKRGTSPEQILSQSFSTSESSLPRHSSQEQTVLLPPQMLMQAPSCLIFMKQLPAQECSSRVKVEAYSNLELQLISFVVPKRYLSSTHSVVVMFRSSIRPAISVSCVTYRDIFVFQCGFLILPSKESRILSSFLEFIAFDRLDFSEMKKIHSCRCYKFCQSSAVNPLGSGLPMFLAVIIESQRRDMVSMLAYLVMLNKFCILVIKGPQRSVIYLIYWLWEAIVLLKMGVKVGHLKKLKEKRQGQGRNPSGKAYYLSSSSSAPANRGIQRCFDTFLSFGPLPKGYMPQSRLRRL